MLKGYNNAMFFFWMNVPISMFSSSFIVKGLYSINISQRFPKDLGNLTNLVSLNLYLTNLNGPIPPTVGKLSNYLSYMSTNLLHYILLPVYLTFVTIFRI